MSSRRRIAFFCPCTPDPRGTGWEQRAYAFLHGYSQIMDVDLWFMPTVDNLELARASTLAPLCSSITVFYPCVFGDPQYSFKARLFHCLSRAEIVHVYRMQQFVANVDHKTIVWDIDELPWSANEPGGARTAARAQTDALRSTFARVADRCRVVIACSPLERPDSRTEFVVQPNVLPNVALGEDFPVRTDASTPPNLLFVGNLNYLPNIDGLSFFTEQVLPHLLVIAPDLRVTVVGRSPSTDAARSAVAGLQQSAQVEFVFDPPSCTPYYLQATVAIAPIRMGAGTRLKIIEAFAHRVPVVSTTKGCEALDVHPGRELLVADDAQEFAQACASLLRDPQQRQRIAENGYEVFAKHHSQTGADRLVRSLVDRLIPG